MTARPRGLQPGGAVCHCRPRGSAGRTRSIAVGILTAFLRDRRRREERPHFGTRKRSPGAATGGAPGPAVPLSRRGAAGCRPRPGRRGQPGPPASPHRSRCPGRGDGRRPASPPASSRPPRSARRSLPAEPRPAPVTSGPAPRPSRPRPRPSPRSPPGPAAHLPGGAATARSRCRAPNCRAPRSRRAAMTGAGTRLRCPQPGVAVTFHPARDVTASP